MLPIMLERANITDFDAPRVSILTGDALEAVKLLEASILQFGLLNPIVVTRSHGRLHVIDGKLRLTVLRRLEFSGRLPRSLATIPFLVADSASLGLAKPISALAMLSNIEQFEQVDSLAARGMNAVQIAAVLYAPLDLVKDLLAVEDLSPRLRNAYFGGHIDLAQARAFATLPNPDSQDALLLALGPFVAAPDILRAIADGQTVLDMGCEDETLILPSRAPVPAHISAHTITSIAA